MAYFSNASEADVLDEQCADCPLGYGWNDPAQGKLFDDEPQPKPCPVVLIQMTYNYTQMRKGNEHLRDAMSILISSSGECKVRSLLVECRSESNGG